MTKDYFWRTSISGAVYVDSDSGDDINGDGTKTNPYQTLGRAYRGSATKPGTIVCRGFFSEDMADGNHACAIYGEYPGAAIFDGNNVYTFYGFTIYNMIVNNCPAGNSLTTVYTASPFYAGCGRATYSGTVGFSADSTDFPGFAGSNCVFRNCGHYWGHVGGQGNWNVISNPKHNDTYKLFLWGNTTSTNWCIHGIKKADRTTNKNSTATGNNFFKAIFTDVAFYMNDHITFNGCYFGKDCTWWNQSTGEEIILEGKTSEERIKFLEEYFEDHGSASTNCTFVDCVFTDKSASEIYNNHELGDFTTKLDSGIPSNIGVFGPALNIPIVGDEALSRGASIINSWDANSATNNIVIKDNEITLSKLDYDPELPKSEISTGLISIDVDNYSVRSLFTEIASKFDKQIVINDKEVTGESYSVGTTLPIGKYIAKGDVTYKTLEFKDGDIITVLEEGTTFSKHIEYEGTPYLVELTNPNIEVSVYVRTFSSILDIQNKTSHTLEEGNTYAILEADGDITTNFGRKVYKGSVIDAKEGNTLSSTSNIKLATMNLLNSDWCPCQTWGNLFVIRNGNEIVKDSDGVPLSSGNSNCYNASANSGTIKTGYNDVPLSYKYLQFKLIADKVC